MVQLREVLAALIIFVATYLFLAGAEMPFLALDRPLTFRDGNGQMLAGSKRATFS